MRRVFFNADDFGLTDGVSDGIVRAMRDGAVASTSAMVCADGARARLGRWAPAVPGRVGIHLQLTDGVPVSDPAAVPSLVTADGRFPRKRRLLGVLDLDDIRREWFAQVEALASLGVAPAHVDTHHDVHRLPVVFDVYCEVAKAFGLPARALSYRMAVALRMRGVRCADTCEADWYGGDLSPEGLLARVEVALVHCGHRGNVELACHPGLADDALAERSDYVAEREVELETLCRDDLAGLLRSRHIELLTDRAALA